MFKKYSFFLVLVYILFTMTGCQEVDNLGTNGGVCYDNLACDAGLICLDGLCQPTNEIRSNTVVITTMEANNDLQSGSDGRVLNFLQNSRSEKFKKGQIVAFQKNEKFKEGLVARIDSTKTENGLVTLNVSIINPLLALGKVKLDIKRIISESQDSSLFIPNEEEIEAFKNLRKDDLRFSKTKDIPYEASWKGDVLKFSGTLKLSYLLEALIDVNYPGSFSEALSASNYGINEFEVKNTFNANVDATLDINVDKDAGFQEIEKSYSKDVVKDLNIASFPIPLPVTAIQFMGHVEVSLKLIPKAHIEGTANIKASSYNTIKANLHYLQQKPADWDTNYQKTFDYSTTNNLTEDVRVEGTASVAVQIIPAFKVTANAGLLGEFANIEFGTEIDFTPIKLEATLKQHLEADNNSFGVDARACLRADAELSINPYASVEMSFMGASLYSKKWNADKKPLVKGWSWLDFMVSKGYLGSSIRGCHEGLENKDGRCRAKEFWSVVGQGDDGLKCVQLLCSEDEQCQVNEATSKDKCIRNRCTTPEDALNNNANYELVTIPAGSFTRGCVDGDTECLNSELPARSVEMPEYKIGKYEVTNTQYKACVDAGKCKAPTTEEYLNADSANHPVANVSWTDAYSYCVWAGDLRLPTEAEWEKAAKGSSNNLYVWGSDEPTCDLTVMESEDGIDGCGENSSSDVGSKSSDTSSYGVMDMAGNVSEWTNDYFDAAYYKSDDSLNNPKGPRKMVNNMTYMTIRGGSWGIHSSKTFRNSNRNYLTFTDSDSSIGFRCAK
jgi:formylglycine-generating enzyme required for sulfatase activity